MVQNKALVFREVPKGMPVVGEHIKIEEWPIDLDASLNEGDILVQVLYASLDPYHRGRLRDAKIPSYSPAFKLNEPIDTRVVAKVVKSNSSQYQEGDLVTGHALLANYAVISKEKQKSPLEPTRKISNPHKVDLGQFLNALGNPGLTAWGGLEEIGQPKKGETIFVSAASGAVGQLVCQIAKHKGLQVVGSAGEDRKVQWLEKELGIQAFNYKKEDTAQALKRLAPSGIDIFWDNVGGKTLEDAIDAMKNFGRIPVCGQIAGYNSLPDERYGVKNLFQLVAKQIRMQGFLSMTYFKKYDEEYRDTLGKWLADGSLKATLDVTEGIEKSGDVLIDIFNGKNLGKSLVKIADV